MPPSTDKRVRRLIASMARLQQFDAWERAGITHHRRQVPRAWAEHRKAWAACPEAAAVYAEFLGAARIAPAASTAPSLWPKPSVTASAAPPPARERN